MTESGPLGRLAGKTAVVTGAASLAGIGFATARAMTRQGANVCLTDLDGEAVISRARELTADGGRAHGMRHDVTVAADWQATLDQTERLFGPLDVLVNNAGIAVLRRMESLLADEWARQINVNLTSVYLGCQAGLERMRRHGHSGSIINVSSTAGLVGMQGCSAYSASKGGVRLLSKSLALEVAAEGIRVNSVHPGVIDTDIQKVAIADNREQFEQVKAAIPMRRMGQPADVAAMILFLACDESQYVTGAEFAVDGGITAQ